MAAPARRPMVWAAIMTGNIPRVATIGPMAGKEPNGVKQTMASMVRMMQKRVKYWILLCCIFILFSQV